MINDHGAAALTAEGQTLSIRVVTVLTAEGQTLIIRVTIVLTKLWKPLKTHLNAVPVCKNVLHH